MRLYRKAKSNLIFFGINRWQITLNTEKLLVLILLSTSCSVPYVEKNSNLIAVRKQDDSNNTEWKDNFVASPNWKITSDNPYGRIAIVSATGRTPDGETSTIFKLQCPAEQNSTATISFLVRNTEKIIGFNFSDFEGPNAPASKKKLVEIEAISPRGRLSFKTNTSGWYAAPNVFVFSPGTTKSLEHLVAEGSTEVTFIVHDNRNYQKTIAMKFPAMDSSSDVVKLLDLLRNKTGI